MPFKPGHNSSKGRPKGASNKSTEAIKRNISMLLENNINTVQSDLDEMQPSDRVNALLQFMKFVIPTQKVIELDNRESEEEKNEAYIQKLMEIPDESLFGVKMYKSLKAAKISTKLYEGSSGYYRADGGTTILMGDILIYFKSTEDE